MRRLENSRSPLTPEAYKSHLDLLDRRSHPASAGIDTGPHTDRLGVAAEEAVAAAAAGESADGRTSSDLWEPVSPGAITSRRKRCFRGRRRKCVDAQRRDQPDRQRAPIRNLVSVAIVAR